MFFLSLFVLGCAKQSSVENPLTNNQPVRQPVHRITATVSASSTDLKVASAPRVRQSDPKPLPAGHCVNGEVAYFTCTLRGGNVLSLCGSSDLNSESAHLQYRYGSRRRANLYFPEESEHSLSRFSFHVERRVRSMGDTVHFELGSYHYSISSMSGADHIGDREIRNFKGVYVEKDGKVVALHVCRESPVDSLSQLAEVLTNR